MLKCKSATLTPKGGINTIWEDNKDPTKKYEICFPPEIAEAFVNYSNTVSMIDKKFGTPLTEEHNEKESEEE